MPYSNSTAFDPYMVPMRFALKDAVDDVRRGWASCCSGADAGGCRWVLWREGPDLILLKDDRGDVFRVLEDAWAGWRWEKVGA